MEKENQNVFAGKDAIKKFLNPDLHPSLPLVELPEALNPFLKDDVHIFAKLMYFLPLLNIKSLPALNMLLEAEKSGKLKDVHTIVENSSGNTAFSLGIVAPIFGIKNVNAIVPFDIAPGKLELLRLAGVKPMLNKDVEGEPTGIKKAKEMGKQLGFFNPGQYENEANPESMEKWLAPQIWKQTKGKISVFCAGLGTTGTILGTSRYLKKKSAGLTVVGVNCEPEAAIPGVRTLKRLGEISFGWKNIISHRVEAGTKESYKKSLSLCRLGLMAGPSSGFALAGLLKFLEQQKADSALDRLRNKGGKVVAVFICPDTPFPYLDKYSTHLDPSDF
jgi:cysteine synthase